MSYRETISGTYRLRRGDADFAALVYLGRSTLQLFGNDTLFAFDPIHGDGLEQDDARTFLGATLRASDRQQWSGLDLRTTAGVQARSDGVDNAVYGEQARERFDTRAASHIDQREIAAFVEETMAPARWLRFKLGVRGDDVGMTVADSRPAMTSAAGARDKALLSPKWSVALSPTRWLDLFADYGRGFHSNDARGVVAQGATLLVPATGYEVGARLEPIRHLSFSAALFRLDLDSELVFDPDTATTAASGATRRDGLELLARYHLDAVVFADAALTFTKARFRVDDGTGTLVPLAPPRTFAAGIGVRKAVGTFTPFGSLRVKSIADRPATQDGSLVAQGFTLVDAEAGVRWRWVEGAVDILNALDQEWRDGQYAAETRLASESKPVTGMTFVPGSPREVAARATVYW